MYIIWAIIGTLLILWDMYKRNTCKLAFACSFLFNAIIAYKFPEKPLYQGIGLIVFSIIAFILIKKILKNEKLERLKSAKLDDCIGKTAIVTKDIGKTLSVDGIGFIIYKDELYKAKSINDKEIKKGQKVIILSKENTLLNVEATE